MKRIHMRAEIFVHAPEILSQHMFSYIYFINGVAYIGERRRIDLLRIQLLHLLFSSVLSPSVKIQR